MKLVNWVVGTLLVLAPVAVNAQSYRAGGNYSGVFGDGRTTASLQVRVVADVLDATFDVSSRADDGTKYNGAFTWNSVDEAWSTRIGGDAPSSSLAVRHALTAWVALTRPVRLLLIEKAADLGLEIPDYPVGPSILGGSIIESDSERINIH